MSHATQEFQPPLPERLLNVLASSRLCYLATIESSGAGAVPSPHLSLMTYTYLDDEELGPVLIMTTRRDTLKYRAMEQNPNLAVLVHDFGTIGPDAAVGTLAITLYGRATLPEGDREVYLRAVHLAQHPKASNFIAGPDYALLAFSPSFARMCNVKDEVSTWSAPSPKQAPKSLHIAVGSTNGTKISAVTAAFTSAFPDRVLSVSSFSTSSGVSSQPMGDLETRRGALNRAEAAAAAAASTADFAVGLEGGCGDDIDGALTCFAWMAILPTGEGARASTARTATLLLPNAVAELVRSGTELGEADDVVFGRQGSKHKDGAVGILTRGLVDRAAYYEHALLMALAPIISEDKYKYT